MRFLPRLAGAAAIAAFLTVTAIAPCLAEEPAATQNEDITKAGKKSKKKGRWAESGRPPGRVVSDRWGFYVGTYVADFKTEAAAGTGALLGTFVRIEDQLGLGEDDETFRAEGFYRFNPRHGLDFGVWDLGRQGTKTIEEEIEWQGKVYQAGAVVNTEFDTSWIRVAYKYSMVNTRRAEAGITAGLSTYNFKLGLQGQAVILDPNGVVLETDFNALTEDVLAPVPTFGFFLTYAMRPRLLFRLRADVMDLTLGDLDGSLVDTAIGVEWYFSRHAGIGLVSNNTSIEYSKGGKNPYSIDYKQRGWVAYFTFVFGHNGAKPGGS